MSICAFIGHRKIENKEDVKQKLTDTVTAIIEKTDTFLFGSKSQFDDISLDVITQLKEYYPHIKRVYIRSDYEIVSEDYKDYLLTLYDETFYPEKVKGAGYRSYIKRNQAMIDMCDILITYCDKEYKPSGKSGTVKAVEYAKKRNKRIINLYEQD